MGFGLGMFIDGIVFHQLLQWHHLVAEYESTTNVPGLETNTFWDGVFHASAWAVTLLGAVLLWRSRSTPIRFRGTAFAGLLLVGWGVFNVVDAIAFHLVLGMHHIRQVENYEVYDASYFAAGLALVALGWFLIRSGRPVPKPC